MAAHPMTMRGRTIAYNLHALDCKCIRTASRTGVQGRYPRVYNSNDRVVLEITVGWCGDSS